MSFWYLQIFQKNNEMFSRISALASKMRSNQKNKGHFIPLIRGFYFDSYTTFLIWPPFPGKFFVVFLDHMKTPKGHFKINWPLAEAVQVFVGSVQLPCSPNFFFWTPIFGGNIWNGYQILSTVIYYRELGIICTLAVNPGFILWAWIFLN